MQIGYNNTVLENTNLNQKQWLEIINVKFVFSGQPLTFTKIHWFYFLKQKISGTSMYTIIQYIAHTKSLTF